MPKWRADFAALEGHLAVKNTEDDGSEVEQVSVDTEAVCTELGPLVHGLDGSLEWLPKDHVLCPDPKGRVPDDMDPSRSRVVVGGHSLLQRFRAASHANGRASNVTAVRVRSQPFTDA